MKIIQSNITHLDKLAPLFDSYRHFYKQSSDLQGAKDFLTQRLQKQDSIIYMAFQENKAVGFTQLYPLFSSVSMQPMILLNDLFVSSGFRDMGFGKALIEMAMQHCYNNNQKGIAIQTEITNPAQNLYKRMGFKIDPDFHLFWKNEHQ